jgi:DNA-binding response OmpR family regulator
VTLPTSARPAHVEEAERLPVVVMLASAEQVATRVAADLSGKVRVIGTTDPTRLASVARAETPDAVVLDASAPELGTWRALSSLQADPATAGYKIVLIARDGETMDALDLGTFRLLTKPLQVERVTHLLLADIAADERGPILVADDDTHVRRILADALGSETLPVYTAADTDEAARLAANELPVLAVIDLFLRGHGLGLGLITRIRALDPQHRVPIAVLVGRDISQADMEQLEDALEATALTGDAPLLPIAQILSEVMGEASEAQANAA